MKRSLIFLSLLLTSCAQRSAYLSKNSIDFQENARTKHLRSEIAQIESKREQLDERLYELKKRLFSEELKEIEKQVNAFEKFLPDILENPEYYQELTKDHTTLFVEQRATLIRILEEDEHLNSKAQEVLDRLLRNITKLSN